MLLEMPLVEWLLIFAIRLAIAAGIVWFGRFLARRSRPAVAKLLQTPKLARTIGPTLVNQLVRLCFGLIWGAAIALALIVLGVPAAWVLGIIALVAILVGVALRESLTNLAATVIFYMYDHFRPGELIQTMGHIGVVQEIQLFNLALLLADQRIVTLPSNKVQEAGVTNYSRTGILRVDVECILAYGASLDRVKTIWFDLARRHPLILQDRPSEFFVSELRDAGVRLTLRAYAAADNYWPALSDLRGQAMQALTDAGIEFAAYRYTLSTTSGNAPDTMPDSTPDSTPDTAPASTAEPAAIAPPPLPAQATQPINS